MKKQKQFKKLNVIALALGMGGTWSILMLISGIGAMFGWADKIVEVMASAYIGFEPTVLGVFSGVLWGFFDGALLGALIALIHNCVITNIY